MDEAEVEQNQLISSWHTEFRKGTDFDLWGQPVEAADTYRRLGSHIKEEVKAENNLFTDQQKKILNKVITCLEIRSKSLQTLSKLEAISLEDVKQVELRLHSLLTSNCQEFPIDVTGIQMSLKEQSTSPETDNTAVGSVNTYGKSKGGDEFEEGVESIEDSLSRKVGSTLLPALDPIPNKTLITIRIEKICLKDAIQLLEPYMSVSVKNMQCSDLCPVQNTGVALIRDENAISFGTDVHIPVPLEDLDTNFAVFFELKHYKPKKKQVSVKCWAFMERDEVKEAPVVIELYKKPTNYKRKKIRLLTVKPLYLHLKLMFHT